MTQVMMMMMMMMMIMTMIMTQEEGEYYNVPVIAEGEDLAANLKKMRVRRLNF